MFTASVEEFCDNHDVPVESIGILALQVSSMLPSAKLPTPSNQKYRTGSDLQSWADAVALKTGITTVTDLLLTQRSASRNDLASSPSMDSLFLHHPNKFRACVTISDLLHITIIPPQAGEVKIQPFSSVCGPGTIFIDYAMRYATSNRIKSDHDGHYSSQGIVNQNVVDQFFEENNYSTQMSLLSIATEMFGHHEAQDVIDECLFLGMTDHDIVATITRIVAENIAHHYKKLADAYCPSGCKIDEIFIGGPGARNVDIVNYLEEALLGGVTLKPLEDIGIPCEAKEALSCAQLGLETILKLAVAEDGSSDRSHQNRLTSSVTRGRQWQELQEHVLKFSGGREISAVKRVVVDKG
jgi:1,6-anhydro-N-acetylmuramate kinase